MYNMITPMQTHADSSDAWLHGKGVLFISVLYANETYRSRHIYLFTF